MFKYFRGNATFAGAILELKGSIQYIKMTFIEIISLMKHHNINTFVLKYTFSLKVKVVSGQYIKYSWAAVDKWNSHSNFNHDHKFMAKLTLDTSLKSLFKPHLIIVCTIYKVQGKKTRMKVQEKDIKQIHNFLRTYCSHLNQSIFAVFWKTK